jgi:hypothetical protein
LYRDSGLSVTENGAATSKDLIIGMGGKYQHGLGWYAFYGGIWHKK